jgi:hypothetical protein
MSEVNVQEENRRFVEHFANPHSWFLTADDLHEQAAALYRGRSQSGITTKADGNNRILRQTVGIDKSVFLLGGFALENAIKAFLVYENPQWISEGRLSGKLKSHSLTKLHGLSGIIPFEKKHLWVLEEFESGLDSWFRYPCALTIATTLQDRDLLPDLWEGYETLMRAYGKKLTTLLDKGWKGPCGFYGRWETRGEFLGYKTVLRPVMPK